jgi:hypothetical protein
VLTADRHREGEHKGDAVEISALIRGVHHHWKGNQWRGLQGSEGVSGGVGMGKV